MSHHLVADRLSELITTAGSSDLLTRDDSARPVADLVHEIVPRRRLAALQLSDGVAAAAAEVIEEHRRAELLRSHGIEPRNRILLEGPPGNGSQRNAPTRTRPARSSASFPPCCCRSTGCPPTSS